MANDDNADLSKRIYLECECNDFDHTVRFSLWDWNNYTVPAQGSPPELCIDYRLNYHESFFDRLVSAVRYVFGRGTLDYHDVLIGSEGVQKLRSLCDDYKLADDTYWNAIRESKEKKDADKAKPQDS
jgi:hypothetical protein